jgi:hypothetical protein
MALVTNALELDDNISVCHCATCGKLFYRGRDNHRFCSIECGKQWHMAERRAALTLYRAVQAQRRLMPSLLEDEDERPRTRMVG